MASQIVVSATPTKSELLQLPVTIIGQSKNLAKLSFEAVSCKLSPQVTPEHFKNALDVFASDGSVNTVPLYLHLASIVQLPSKCSRHNTPTQAHALSKAVSRSNLSSDEAFVIVCEKQDAFASACAVARCFPLYNKKSGDSADGEKLPKADRKIHLEFVLTDGSSICDEDLVAFNAAIESVRLAARIVDTPCEEMNVCAFLREIEAVGASLNIKPNIIRGEELLKRGIGGIWSVGRAATSLPALAVLSHTPEGATQTVAWVGKGIVYDTGGLSLKARTNMIGMKRDCGGAAGILGAFKTAVTCGFKQNLHAVFCLAENAIGPLAIRPDDVIRMYSGKSVEVNNTDAEGRLVLADGVVFASRDLGAKTILDMATLTGAQGIGTGKYHAAIVTNSGKWEDASAVAGRLSGDLTFPCPYSPELHFKEFSSSIADMKNSVADRGNAQISCAALFIQSHLGFDFDGDWIHVDMAYPVASNERATGYGVALLTSLFAEHSTNSCVRALSPFNAEENDKKRAKTN
ncbi:probable aminopeptidase NPEPL1 [Galendromus occidentalis]|uniref:Probable aminopeptidase NPEPL1 n=1 Tax=Galendromus occidentalis TaxID=34638 RepID=A0AAJ6VX46_9ACAR|nr:probable aminopeptidase NPEPL1 [Galendromus occidentalis]